MDLSERVASNQNRATTEHSKMALEKKAKDEALRLVRETQSSLNSVREELKKEVKAKEEAGNKAKKMEKDLNTENGISESLRKEIKKPKEEFSDKNVELVTVIETLERVEHESNITYEDCVRQYKGTIAFTDEVVEKAAGYHEEGYNDCLKFIGIGNVVDLELHLVEHFRNMELEKYE